MIIMNKRLVWNFEISGNNLLDWQDLPQDEKEEFRWEARFFWPDEKIITLDGLDDNFLTLSNYQIKQRLDYYSLLTHYNYNIKQRRSQLLYKPLLKETGTLRAYGKKINLADYSPHEILPGTAQLYAANLLAEVQNDSQTIQVIKEALIYKWAARPTIKLELARLQLQGKNYFSVSIEGHSEILVSKIAKRLLKEYVSCDYVSFLKQTLVSC